MICCSSAYSIFEKKYPPEVKNKSYEMVVTLIDRINDVVTSVETARCSHERDMYKEYERSSNWLSEVAMVRKLFRYNICKNLQSTFK